MGLGSREWHRLVSWLVDRHGVDPRQPIRVSLSTTSLGRGLVASEDIPAGQVVLKIPRSALLNLSTLPPRFRDLYPALTSTQLLSFYLARHCPPRHVDTPFEPFIDILPTSFATTPLHWSLPASLLPLTLSDAPRLRERLHQVLLPKRVLFRSLSATAKIKADDVLRRFCDDWDRLAGLGVEQVTVADFFFGWMNVNSRCVYLDLGLEPREDNLTLAPVIDLANHALASPLKMVQNPDSLALHSSDPNRSTTGLKRGDIVEFEYGPHDDPTLLAEYGFTFSGARNRYDAIDVTALVEARFAELDHATRDEAEGELRTFRYWRDWTIQCTPPEPSHRTLVALRLLHLVSQPPPKRRRLKDPPLEAWRKMAWGETEVVSDENEAAVRATVASICEEVEAEDKAKLAGLADEDKTGWDEAELASASMVEAILERELAAVGGVRLEMKRSN